MTKEQQVLVNLLDLGRYLLFQDICLANKCSEKENLTLCKINEWILRKECYVFVCPKHRLSIKKDWPSIEEL